MRRHLRVPVCSEAVEVRRGIEDRGDFPSVPRHQVECAPPAEGLIGRSRPDANRGSDRRIMVAVGDCIDGWRNDLFVRAAES